MSSESYMEHVRNSRKRPSVLKTKVLTIRSGDSDSPIFIFEGKTDIGPYETWIKRINSDLFYKGVPADGKAQALEFRDYIKDSSDEDLKSIYFFVDHDYDGLREYEKSNDIFCLDSYSFENYLVSHYVLESILNDEFECAANPDSVQSAIILYEKVFDEFCEAMHEANFRLYLAAKYDIDRGRIENRINQFVAMNIDSVTKIYDSSKIKNLIPLLKEFNENEINDADKDFLSIGDPKLKHRGKYVFSFFLAWLDLLAEARRNGTSPFGEKEKIKYNRAFMSARSLASRSAIPNGLRDFICQVNSSMAA